MKKRKFLCFFIGTITVLFLAFLIFMFLILKKVNYEEDELLFRASKSTSITKLYYNAADELGSSQTEKYQPKLYEEIIGESEKEWYSYGEISENVKTAFFAHKRTVVRDRDILLIDDIMTTGATGNACARVLKNAGANKVIFLTAVSLNEQKR